MNKPLFKEMMGLYERLIKYDIVEAKLYGYLAVYENNIKRFEEMYWNMDLHVGYLADYYKKNEMSVCI